MKYPQIPSLPYICCPGDDLGEGLEQAEEVEGASAVVPVMVPGEEWEEKEAEAEEAEGAVESEAEGAVESEAESDEEVVLHFDSADKAFMCKAADPEQSEAAVAAAPGTFKSTPSYVFLEERGLVSLPAVDGVGVAVHLTNSTWQVRYPPVPGKKGSRCRSWGKVAKKGYVPPCAALLQCLLWCWETHLERTGSALAKDQVEILKEALNSNVGSDVK